MLSNGVFYHSIHTSIQELQVEIYLYSPARFSKYKLQFSGAGLSYTYVVAA